ncbi:MAG TPA: PfkB family carbohydrate kinase [Candidatus Baltobacteraceae bacterium]|nr:PfkB family carbohydrate kinase [Candidatus Baltobacteraceae bacterium]
MSEYSEVHGIFVGLVPLNPVEHVNGASDASEGTSGGSAANAAMTFAMLGGRATLLTLLGAQGNSQTSALDLESCGISVVDFSGRSEDDLWRLVGGASVVFCDGSFPEIAARALTIARRIRVPTVLEGGSRYEHLSDLLPLVDTVICAQGFSMPGTQNEDEVLQALLNCGVSLACITHGKRSVLWKTQSAFGEVGVVHDSANDTLGATGVFHGAFCSHIAENWQAEDPAESCAFAAQITALSTGSNSAP